MTCWRCQVTWQVSCLPHACMHACPHTHKHACLQAPCRHACILQPLPVDDDHGLGSGAALGLAGSLPAPVPAVADGWEEAPCSMAASGWPAGGAWAASISGCCGTRQCGSGGCRAARMLICSICSPPGYDMPSKSAAGLLWQALPAAQRRRNRASINACARVLWGEMVWRRCMRQSLHWVGRVCVGGCHGCLAGSSPPRSHTCGAAR